MAQTRKIGAHEVYPVGFGCMNLNHAYGDKVTKDEGIRLLQMALDLGCTFFDTATLYGMGRNEELVGAAFKGHRDRITLASKCVLGFDEDGNRFLDARPETIRKACDASLKRLQTDVIDLYYMHRPDPNVPIEDSVGVLAELVEAGKIRMIGLSEMSADMIRQAHTVHPIAAVQSEYSLMTRNPEIAVLNTCLELGITFVPFSPVGRGVFSDVPLNPDRFAETDMRRIFPRFSEPHFSANQKLIDQAAPIARDLGCSVGQLSLAWILAKDETAVPIPGTVREDHLKENITAVNVKLSEDILNALDAIFAPDKIAGARYAPSQQKTVTTEQFDFEEKV